jgi:hypothetical protein
VQVGDRVRVKSNGRTGTIRSVRDPGPPGRYVVMYDDAGTARPLGDTTPPEAGQDWSEDNLEPL